jgi:hypothetical protein
MISMLIQVPKIRSFLVQSINGPYDFITQQQQTKAQFFTYALDFEMVNCVAGAANGVQFLLEFLRALAKMEIDSSVLLSNSTSEDQKIDATTNFPAVQSTDQSILKAFVFKYIGGLRLTRKSSMQGKITVRTRFKFAALNKNKDVREFLQGEWSERKNTRVRLLLHSLDCTIRHQVGFFLNTITRYGMVQSLSQRIGGGWFEDWKEVLSKDFPPFQVEVQTIYCDKAPANYYRILTAKEDVETVAQALLKLFPQPLQGCL